MRTLTLLMAVLAATPAYAGKKTQCSLMGGVGGWTIIRYEDREVVEQAERESAAAEGREPVIDTLPASGRVRIEVHRTSQALASLDSFELVFLTDDTESAPLTGPSDSEVAPPPPAGGLWSSEWLVPAPATTPFSVFVVDNHQNVECGALVDPGTGQLKKAKR